jgi:hypothetical protein
MLLGDHRDLLAIMGVPAMDEQMPVDDNNLTQFTTSGLSSGMHQQSPSVCHNTAPMVDRLADFGTQPTMPSHDPFTLATNSAIDFDALYGVVDPSDQNSPIDFDAQHGFEGPGDQSWLDNLATDMDLDFGEPDE